MIEGQIRWIEGRSLTPLQRVSVLLLNLSRVHRRRVIKCIDRAVITHSDRAGGPLLNPYAETVARACHRALQPCNWKQRWLVLNCAEQVADLLEWQQAEFEKQQAEIQIVATIPEFLRLAQDGALPPVEHGSLRTGMRDVLLSARQHLDICIPYISVAGADDLTAGLRRGSRRGMAVRILSLLTDDQSVPGACRVAERFEDAGARSDIRSPTKEEALMIDAIAAMHAKLIVSDRGYAYLGTGNISLSALHRALEIGVIVKGVLAKNLSNLFQWTFIRHQRWGLPLESC